MARLTEIWRHPIKSLGREPMETAGLTPESWLPGDRLWAVTHSKTAFDAPEPEWQSCSNFLRCTHGPSLMAITAELDESGAQSRQVTLHHPAAGHLTLAPDTKDAFVALKAWLRTIWPDDLPAPTGLYANAAGSLTDNPDPWLSIHNHASHRAVEDQVGKPLSIHRWRGNLWLEGLGPWQEFEWIGKEIRIGGAVLRVEERIGRCRATMANPETGQRDADTLAALDTWGHRDFGVFARVIEGGEITIGDPAHVPG